MALSDDAFHAPEELGVIRARGEEVCRLAIPTAELLGDTPYVPSSR
jgi:hypothetical protein